MIKLWVYSSATNIKTWKNYLLSQKPSLISYRTFNYAYHLFNTTLGSMIKLLSENISSSPLTPQKKCFFKLSTEYGSHVSQQQVFLQKRKKKPNIEGH